MWWNTHATVGKDTIRGGLIKQVNAQCTKYHRVVGRAGITVDAHRLCRVQRLRNTRLHQQFDGGYVKRVLERVAIGNQAVITQVIVLRRVRRKATTHLYGVRRVVDRHAGANALLKSGGIDKWLER